MEVTKDNMQNEIDVQIQKTESRGEKVTKYLNLYKGQNIYNEIDLAIEFGFQLAMDELTEKDK